MEEDDDASSDVLLQQALELSLADAHGTAPMSRTPSSTSTSTSGRTRPSMKEDVRQWRQLGGATLGRFASQASDSEDEGDDPTLRRRSAPTTHVDQPDSKRRSRPGPSPTTAAPPAPPKPPPRPPPPKTLLAPRRSLGSRLSRRLRRLRQLDKGKQRPQQPGAAAEASLASQLRGTAHGDGDGDGEEAATPQRLPEYVAMVLSEHAPAELEGTHQIRRLLSRERAPPIRSVVQSGVVPRLISFLERQEQPRLQFEAAWALTNIASGTSEDTVLLTTAGIVPKLVDLLMGCEDEEVRDQAVWCLGNIAGDSTLTRDLVLDAAHAVDAVLLQLSPRSRTSLLRNATWCASNLCRGKPAPALASVRPFVAKLAQVVQGQDDEVLTDACWAFSYLSDGDEEHIEAVVSEHGVLARMLELVASDSRAREAIRAPALRTVGNLVTGSDAQTQVVIDAGALPLLKQLLDSTRQGVRKEAMWALSNVAAGTSGQIQAMLDEPGLMVMVLEKLLDDAFEVQKEAIWLVQNALVKSSAEQVDAIVQCNVLTVLVEELAELNWGSHPLQVKLVLKSFKAVMEADELHAEALRKLDAEALIASLVQGDDDNVAALASTVLDLLAFPDL